MIDVACAIIFNDKEEILATQRSEMMKLPLKWEFPGGKIETDETAEECLIREIKEELSINISIIKALTPITHQYDDFNIRLFPFICKIASGEIQLAEHANHLWLLRERLFELDWAEADLPILNLI